MAGDCADQQDLECAVSDGRALSRHGASGSLANELCTAVREELMVRHREWSVKQAQVQTQQLETLLASVEHLLQTQSRQISCRLELEFRRLEALGQRGGATEDAASTSERGRGDVSLGRRGSPRLWPQPIRGPASRSGVSLGASPASNVEDLDEGAPPWAQGDRAAVVRPPVAPLVGIRLTEPLQLSSSKTSSPVKARQLQLPSAAVRPCGSALYRAALPLGSPHGRHLGTPPSNKVLRLSSSDLGGSEEEEVPDERLEGPGERAMTRCDGEPIGRYALGSCTPKSQKSRWGQSHFSPKSNGSALCGGTDVGNSDFRSEATLQHDEARYQWRHHVRQQITRRFSDINSQSKLASAISWFFGFSGQVEAVVRTRTERSLNERPVVESKSRLERLVDSHGFQIICGVVIAANAICIGIETDYSIRGVLATPSRELPAWTTVVNKTFVAFFVVEVALRLMAKRWRFFIAEDWTWNVFDLVLTLYAVCEEWVPPLLTLGGFSYSYTRLAKGFRMVRVLRVIRMMRFCRELRLMVCSITKCIVSLSWAMVLLSVIIYLFTVCFMHAATVYLQDEGDFVADGGKVRNELSMYYGSLGTAMFTLFAAVTGGDDWVTFVAPLKEIHWAYQALFTIYIIFVVVGVVNVFTGAFVQRACELSRTDRDLAIQGEMVAQEAWQEEMKDIFEEVDSDKSGQITWDKFRLFMENSHVQAYFATQQLDTSDARELFALLDTDGDGRVGLEEFIMGCQQLRGQAKSSDVATLLRESKRTSRKFLRSLRKMEVRVAAICASMSLDVAEITQSAYWQSPLNGGDARTPASTLAGGLSPASAWRTLGRSVRSSRGLPRSKTPKTYL